MRLPLVLILASVSQVLPAAVDPGYITYYPGTLPVILAAPHGGSLSPDQYPERDAGCWINDACVWTHTCGLKNDDKCSATRVKDLNTKELALLLRDELYDLYEEYPHVIINELSRKKLDANRDMPEATFGVPDIEDAWKLFHTYINESKAASRVPSLFLDLHGHGHSKQWAELGYLIRGDDLDKNNSTNPELTSIRRLGGAVKIPFEDLLRGSGSFGDMLEKESFESVPSPSKPGPSGNPYFNGGYNTLYHGSKLGGMTDTIQIESPSSFRSDEIRPQYAKALAKTIKRYLETHYGYTDKSFWSAQSNGSSSAKSASMFFSLMCGSLLKF